MKKIVIRVKSVTGTLSWPCQYYNIVDRKTWTLTETGSVIVGDAAVIKNIKIVKFTAQFPEIIIQYDEEKHAHIDLKNQHKFWAQSPLVEIYGGKNENMAGNGLLLLVDEGQVKDFKTSLIKSQGEVSDKIRNIGKSGRFNVAVYYGIPEVSKKSDDEILIELIDWQTGILMKPDLIFPATKNRDQSPDGISYMRHYLDEFQDESSSVIMNINVKRAIDSGLIKKDSGVYYFNGAPIGKTENECIAYFVQRPDSYDNSILEGLKMQDNSSELLKNVNVREKAERTSHGKIRSEGHALSINRWESMPIPQLLEAIQKKKQQLMEAANIIDDSRKIGEDNSLPLSVVSKIKEKSSAKT